MSASIAQRRGAKAARRKKLLAARRKGGLDPESASLAQRARRAALQPLYCCLLHDGLLEYGSGSVILVRGTPAAGLTMAAFLVDTFCLGVKDVTFSQIAVSDLEDHLAEARQAAPLRPVDPAYARKLLRDAAAYARGLGFPPHKKYADAELLFGDVSADACEIGFEFGRDGKPHYMPGPSESRAQIRRHLEILRRLGKDAFTFVEADEDSDLHDTLLDLEDDESSDLTLSSDDGYDPAEAPDPAAWLALDEGERMILVQDYHRRAGIELANPNLHATLHVVVENQIALDDPPAVRRAIGRLVTEGGLDRNAALHALAGVLAEYLWTLANDEQAPPSDALDAYVAAVDRLTTDTWRRDFGADRDER